jgi:hypothetical protein
MASYEKHTHVIPDQQDPEYKNALADHIERYHRE